MWDTGTSVGKLHGPAKSCNNVAIKQTRPYRLILASEDYSSYFFEGPPFKYKSTALVSVLFILYLKCLAIILFSFIAKHF